MKVGSITARYKENTVQQQGLPVVWLNPSTTFIEASKKIDLECQAYILRRNLGTSQEAT